MTIKPTKKWVVGDRVFDDYSAACNHARSIKDDSERTILINFLTYEVTWSEGNTEEVADKILARYVLKPRRGAS